MSAKFCDLPVGELLRALACDLPDGDALVFQNQRWSFGELEAESRRLARGLLALGLEPGDRVAVWSPTCAEWILLMFALAKIGAVLVTVNTGLRARELAYLLAQSECRALFMARGFRGVDYVEMFEQARGEPLPHLEHVFIIGDYELPSMASEASLRHREEDVTLDQVINMQYTSGTTGFPKGVMLSSRNIVNNGYWLAEGLGFTPTDRLCLPVPLFHCFGCVIGVLGAYTHGACLAPLHSFDPEEVLQIVERERCTALYGVPTMFLAELEHPAFTKYDLRTLRTGVMAGAPCPEALMRRVMRDMHLAEMTIAYGLTEASPGITLTSRDDDVEHRTQTVGRPLPHVEVKTTESGELCARGYNVMAGYYKKPDETADAINPEGWLHTGDKASIDADGYVRITGRIKDIIIRGGENVSPFEVEDVLRQHPAVLDACVYGVPDVKFGEAVAAALRLRCGAASPTGLTEFCEDKMARFKIPTEVRVVEEFPMTPSGKIQRYLLREAHGQ